MAAESQRIILSQPLAKTTNDGAVAGGSPPTAAPVSQSLWWRITQLSFALWR